MLKLVFGRSGYGKTEYVFNAIKSLVDNGTHDILLITPEQFSLSTERRLLSDLGESGINAVNNSSFTRLSNDVKREFGGSNLPVLSKGGKAVLMMQAIEQSKDSLSLFNKKLNSADFVESMIKIYDEMKSCNLNSSEINQLSGNIENITLKEKMNDIALIMNAYETIIADRYLDSSDELTRLYKKLENKDYFSGKYIFIDGFNGFVAQEYKLLELIIKESVCTVITLCTDFKAPDDRFNLFSYVNDTVKIIKKIASKAGIQTETLELNVNHRASNPELNVLEQNLFSETECFDGDLINNIRLYNAKNITDECNEISRQIRKLLRQGYNANSIAVVVRDLNKYRDELSSTFKKYDIPYFNDERQPVKCQPLVVFIEYLLRCVNFSLRSDDILSLVKTGLTDVDYDDISEIENYIYLWNINGSKWTKPFENSTKGFVSEISDNDRKLLDKINLTRSRIIAPIIRFKNETKNANAQKICEEIYNTIMIFGADKKIKEFAVELAKNNKQSLAQQQGDIWEMVMDILSQLPLLLGEKAISIKDFAKIFSIVISTEDLGTLPSGIDNVQVGQADRIRTDNPMAVFVLGANEGEFPQSVSGGGLLSENDRRLLLKYDFKLYSYGEILNLQERYFAYMACTAAKEKLFVSYIGNSGSNIAPSEIITSIKSIFKNLIESNSNCISDIDLVETQRNAFDLMSERYIYNTEFYASLKEYFRDDSRYNAVKMIAENTDVSINDSKLATSLFGYNMLISASRIEDYFNCSFRYFCKFGLSAKPRRKAEIDPMQRGTLIHYVLEMILSAYGSKKLSQMTDNEIKKAVDTYVSDYFQSEMGNLSDVTLRFTYNFKRLSKLIYGVVIHLAKEFANSDFEPKAFELTIDKDAQVKPEIIDLDDGGTIQIRGSIDRLDTFDKAGQKYVRVVDYKSGNKVFNLSDIINGLNLQMFIYLFSVCEDKTSPYNGIASGVLYMHAARNVFSFDSKKDAENSIADEELSSFKMKGIVISDNDGEIAYAMEHELNGRYIPVKVKKNGDLTGHLATLEELGFMHKSINQLISQMGFDLHTGKISRNPVKNSTHKNTCEYCDYQDVCANARSIENRIAVEMSDDEVKKQLIKEYADNAELDTATK